MEDNRVLNNKYSEKPMHLFLELANLINVPMLEAGPPLVCDDQSTVCQRYGESNLNSGTMVYYRMAGDTVLVWDPEDNVMNDAAYGPISGMLPNNTSSQIKLGQIKGMLLPADYPLPT